ncbi:MAG: ester cyclase [Leptolyngbyaceae cyanobacterium SU_3_3]|nr:ester cyclase [Leptolyngbyaceae cyanobacterium SU_3_3]NJR49619.1 ester cyclase [Leptolyngbyaceae cyanobacterium CSU_1_3]
MTPTEERNIACFTRFIEEGLNQKKISNIADEFINGNIVMEAPGVPTMDGRLKGNDIFKFFTSSFVDAFPDVKCSMAHCIAEGDALAVDVLYEGTHTKEFAGVPATDKYIKGGELWYMLFANGKIRHLKICEYGTPLRAMLLGE